MSDAMERAIKKSAEDTDFEPLRRSPDRLKTGERYDETIRTVTGYAVVPANYTHALVIDYISFDSRWDHNMVNFYYQNDTDPTTTIVSFRAYADGRVESTDVGKVHEQADDDSIVSFIEGKQ